MLTIASVDKEVKDLIQKWHIYGAEVLINALVRTSLTEDLLSKEAINRMINTAYRRANKD